MVSWRFKEDEIVDILLDQLYVVNIPVTVVYHEDEMVSDEYS